MANTNLTIPGETVNPKTGQREFDFDQEKILLINIINAIENVASSNGGNVSAAYAQANLALEIAEEAYSAGNVTSELVVEVNSLATIANTIAYEAILIAEEALASVGGNAAANLVAVYSNGSLVIPNANINFNSTGTVNANVYISTANAQANIEFNANGTAIVGPTAQTANLALFVSNASYAQANIANAIATIGVILGTAALVKANAAANTVAVSNNGTLVLAAANLDFLGTATVNVSVDANGTTQTNVAYTANITAIAGPAFDHANAAFNVAQQANTTANLALPIAGGTITGNLTVMEDCFIDGDLVITGNLVIGANLTVGGVLNVATIIGLTSINQS